MKFYVGSVYEKKNFIIVIIYQPVPKLIRKNLEQYFEELEN